jgi:hypothetical protein
MLTHGTLAARVQVGDAIGLERFGADGADRDRHVLQALLALLCSDDDFFQRGRGGAGVRTRALSTERCSDRQTHETRPGKQPKSSAQNGHDASPFRR